MAGKAGLGSHYRRAEEETGQERGSRPMNTTSPKAEILNRRRADASIGCSSSHPQATCPGSQLENIDRAVTFWHQAVAQWSSPPDYHCTQSTQSTTTSGVAFDALSWSFGSSLKRCYPFFSELPGNSIQVAADCRPVASRCPRRSA
jgi:hypothetical protein